MDDRCGTSSNDNIRGMVDDLERASKGDWIDVGILSLSTLAGAINPRSAKPMNDGQSGSTQDQSSAPEVQADAWGRPLDDASSSDTFDVQEG